jgi:hypothetical protein
MKQAILKHEIAVKPEGSPLDFSRPAVPRSSLLGVSFYRPRSRCGEVVRFAERKVLPPGPFDARSARKAIG